MPPPRTTVNSKRDTSDGCEGKTHIRKGELPNVGRKEDLLTQARVRSAKPRSLVHRRVSGRGLKRDENVRGGTHKPLPLQVLQRGQSRAGPCQYRSGGARRRTSDCERRALFKLRLRLGEGSSRSLSRPRDAKNRRFNLPLDFRLQETSTLAEPPWHRVLGAGAELSWSKDMITSAPHIC